MTIRIYDNISTFPSHNLHLTTLFPRARTALPILFNLHPSFHIPRNLNLSTTFPLILSTLSTLYITLHISMITLVLTLLLRFRIIPTLIPKTHLHDLTLRELEVTRVVTPVALAQRAECHLHDPAPSPLFTFLDSPLLSPSSNPLNCLYLSQTLIDVSKVMNGRLSVLAWENRIVRKGCC